MPQIISNGLAISYHRYGHGATTLLFVHGSFIDQGYWSEQVAFFEQEYTVVTMDLAGHGQSGTNREHWSVAGMADDVVNLLRALDLKRVILIGHSLGGDINLIAATRYPDPVIGFIGIDNFKNAATPLPEIYQSQVQGILDSARKDYAGTNEQYARMVLLTDATPAWISDKIVSAYRNSYAPMGLETLPEFFEMDRTEKACLPLLRCKLNLVNVSYMPTNTAALDLHAVNGYTLTEIPGTSHYPMLEEPMALNKALDQVIRDILDGK